MERMTRIHDPIHDPIHDVSTRLARSSRAFTLLELMIVMGIVALGVALATPSYNAVLQRRHTTSQAEELAAFLSYAQSEAVKSNAAVSVQLSWTNANNWCIGLSNVTTGCDCKTANSCTLDGVEWTMSNATQSRSSMAAHSLDTLFVFDPVRGTMIGADLGNPHDYTLRSDSGNYELKVDVGATGHIRVCNSDSSKQVAGFKSC